MNEHYAAEYGGDVDKPNSPGFFGRYGLALRFTKALAEIYMNASTRINEGEDADLVAADAVEQMQETVFALESEARYYQEMKVGGPGVGGHNWDTKSEQ